MNSGSALWCALTLFLGSLTCPGIEATTADPAPPVSPIAADDQFFVDHPDLKDEAEVVDEASKALAAQGFQAGTAKEASAALAARGHAILAERTPQQWQQKAVTLYPALGVAGSEFNLLFRKHYGELKASSPAFVQEPSWPVLLAKRCDDELRSGNPGASPSVPAPAPAAASPASPPDGKNSVRQTPRSRNFWQTSFALLLLIILTSVPAILVFRPGLLTSLLGALGVRPGALAVRPGALAILKGQSSQPAPSEPSPAPKSNPPIWRTTLKHAAVIYLLVALPASVHSLMANADLGFIDRLFVSLLVGSLFGVFVALPLCGIETLWHACQKHPARHATR
jgi:hypothetical protein